jgi:hypothetical protein
MLDGFTVALRATQVSSFVLGDVFEVLEKLAAFRATILIGRHEHFSL